jgi:hypothetical protein
MDRLMETGSPLVEVNAKPIHKLVIEIPMRTTVSGPVSNLRPWLSVSINGVRAVQGHCATWRSKAPQPGIVSADGPVDVIVHVPLPTHTLAEIERARAGADVEIIIQGEVGFSHAHEGVVLGHAVLGETRFIGFGRNDTGWKHTVAKSDWIKLLHELKWSYVGLLEVPLDLRGRKDALQHLQRAQDHMASGHWPEALGSCYKALEAVVPEAERDTVGEGNPVLSTKGRAALNELVRHAKTFTHEGRHDRPNLPDVGASEARFAFFLAAGLAQLIP